MTAPRLPGHFRYPSSVAPYPVLDLPRQRVPPGFELGRDTPNCNIPRCGAISTFSGDYVVVPPGEVCAGPSLIFHCPRCDEDFLVAAPIWHSRLGYEW